MSFLATFEEFTKDSCEPVLSTNEGGGGESKDFVLSHILHFQK